jgi:RimJ/RimL family protein N-acetyltransferase
VFLETERLTLRRFTPDDLDLLIELDSDPDVMRFISGGRPTSREELEHEILPTWLSYYERFAGYGFWAALEKSSDAFLGWFHLRPLRDTPLDEPELGYRLRKSAWGQGYGTEGSRALIDHAFTHLGATRVYARTMTINTASRRVMEKAGLKFIRTFFGEWPESIPGDEHGDVEYSLTREQWQLTPRR